jgi:hypothetical protein
VFLHVHEPDPLAVRTTRDRRDLEAIVPVASAFGFEYHHAAGADMLFDARQPRAKSAVHMIFVGEKVRPEYVDRFPRSRRRCARRKAFS